MGRIMVVYAEEYPKYLAVQIEVSREVYSDEQMGVLTEINGKHPWIYPKMIASSELTMQKNFANIVRSSGK